MGSWTSGRPAFSHHDHEMQAAWVTRVFRLPLATLWPGTFLVPEAMLFDGGFGGRHNPAGRRASSRRSWIAPISQDTDSESVVVSGSPGDLEIANDALADRILANGGDPGAAG